MTAQLSEHLHYEGKVCFIHTEPLQSYLKKHDMDRSAFTAITSASWRGYCGTWQIKDDRLFLIDFKGNLGFGDEGKLILADLTYLFPHQTEVFAEWFTGNIRIPQGELLEYVHYPYGSVYEKEVVLSFEDGVLIKKMSKDNRKKYIFQRVLKFIFAPLNRYLDRKLAKKDNQMIENMFKND